jgi:hypothetical protein
VIPDATNFAGPYVACSACPGDGRETDYRAARLLLPEHSLDGVLAGQEHAPPVHSHDGVPVLGRGVHDVVERYHAGVGDEYVYAPEPSDRRVDDAPRVLDHRDVADDGPDLSP